MAIELKMTVREIWNQPESVITKIKDWISSQRWSGLQNIKYFEVSIEDWIMFEKSDKYEIVGFVISINEGKKSKKNSKFLIYLPFIFYYDKNLIDLTPDIVIRNDYEHLFLKQAEYFPPYLNLIFNNMRDNIIMNTKKGKKLLFTSKDTKINSLLTDIKILDFKKGETTNFLLKISSNGEDFVLKCYKKVAYNPEPSFLMDLFHNGFENVIKPIALCEYQHSFLNPLYLISEFIKIEADLGLRYWNNLENYFHDTDFREVEQELSNLNEKLINLIIDFHQNSYNLEKINKKIEFYSRDDITFFKNAIKVIINNIYSNDSINKMKFHNKFLKKMQEMENIIDNLHIFIDWPKIRVHQDLHLGQILIEKESNKLIITDFEGDPNRPEIEKNKKDLIFRDLASIITAFLYIQLNKFKNHYSKQDFLEIYLQLDEIKNQELKNVLRKINIWTKTVINNFIKLYYNKLEYIFERSLRNNNFEAFKMGIIIYTYDRIIREIFYELKFRRENLKIPLSMLFILNGVLF